MGEIRYVIAANRSVIQFGSVLRVIKTGKGLWLVQESNGQDMVPAAVFLREGLDFYFVSDPPAELEIERGKCQEFARGLKDPPAHLRVSPAQKSR